MCNSKGHDSGVDIWALGILIVAVIDGKPPLSQYSEETVHRLIAKRKEIEVQNKDNVHKDCLDFLSNCCEKNRELRPNASRLLKVNIIKPKKFNC